MVFCIKLNKNGEALKRAPMPGDLGQRILANISREAWQEWLNKQTILINEYRLNLIEPQAKEFLEEQLLEFLFDEKSS